MRGGRSDGRWLIPVALIAVVAALTFVAAAQAPGRGGSVSQTLSAQVRQAAAPPAPTAEPSLYQVLRAADILARAGAIPAPAPTEVPLIDVLRAADALAKAGLLPTPAAPPLIEILQAADALAKAGKLPPPAKAPPLIDVLRAADALAKAGKLPPPVAPPPAAPPQPPQVTPTVVAPVAAGPGGWYDAGYSGRVWALINQQRAAAGLPAVTVEPRLATAAAAYARVLADNNWFSHVGPDGSTVVTRLEAAGFPFTVPVGEILAWGTQRWSAEAVVQAWMDSPMHRAEILSRDYTRAGASCYFTGAAGVTVRCVMDFAGE